MPGAVQLKLPLVGGKMYRRSVTEVSVTGADECEELPLCHKGQVCVKGGCDHPCTGQEQRRMYDLTGSDVMLPLFH